jgi:hypothetical protein
MLDRRLNFECRQGNPSSKDISVPEEVVASSIQFAPDSILFRISLLQLLDSDSFLQSCDLTLGIRHDAQIAPVRKPVTAAPE